MSDYTATIEWQRADAPFTDRRYSRGHQWRFDGGVTVPASSSPHSVPLPYSVAAAVDPEEAFVAALASCHMLWFLSLAQAGGWRVDSYLDTAVGVLERNAAGKLAITRVTLRPRAVCSGQALPTRADIETLHVRAHQECFIARSVTSEVLCEPIF